MAEDEGAAEPKRGRGQPTAYKPEFCAVAKKMCEMGATDADLAQAFEVNRMTIHRWRLVHPEFAEAMQLGKKGPDDRVERSLYERAIGYYHDVVKPMMVDGKPELVPYIEHVPGDVGAQKIWMMNRRGWRDKFDHEHAGPGGGPIETHERSDIERKRRVAAYVMKIAEEPTGEE